MKRKITIVGSLSILIFLLFSATTFANKTSVKVIAPEKVKKGTEVTIKIEVKHIGNTKGHHTDWVWLKINDKEVKRWEYTKDNLPPDQNFTLEYTVKADQVLKIAAEGHCNRHGSKGEDDFTINIEE